MPYINAKDRKQYEPYIQKVVVELQAGIDVEKGGIRDFAGTIHSAGSANYVISSIIWRLFDAKPSYTFGNDLISAVEDVSAELACKDALVDQGNTYFYRFLHSLCFGMRSNFRGVCGMLTCVVLEFYRRRLAIYEDLKIKEHGDIV